LSSRIAQHGCATAETLLPAFPCSPVAKSVPASRSESTPSSHAAVATFRKNHTNGPVGVLHFWLGCGTEGMSGHYDQIKTDVAFRKNVVNRCGVQPTIIDKVGKAGMPSPVASTRRAAAAPVRHYGSFCAPQLSYRKSSLPRLIGTRFKDAFGASDPYQTPWLLCVLVASGARSALGRSVQGSPFRTRPGLRLAAGLCAVVISRECEKMIRCTD
jgi:hypothetical protein